MDEQEEITYEELALKAKQVITRQIGRLSESVEKGPLPPADSQSLVALAKFLVDMATREEEAAASLSEEELKRIAARNRKKKSRNNKKNSAIADQPVIGNEGQPQDSAQDPGAAQVPGEAKAV